MGRSYVTYAKLLEVVLDPKCNISAPILLKLRHLLRGWLTYLNHKHGRLGNEMLIGILLLCYLVWQ
jgi:hypothetical protein